jgi:NTP pyrophosphatase (non-canonical NTP hydrolase)
LKSPEQLRRAAADFAAERDWDQFHTPKNLAMSVAGEVGELVEIFQWLTAEESVGVMSSPRGQDVRDELADVLIYLVRLADVLDIDLIGAGFEKLQKNALKYPVDEVKGSAEKRKS